MPVTGLPTRRQVLQASAVAPLAALAACSSDGQTPVTDTDDSVRAQVAASENDLIRRYDATIAAYPAVAARLQPLRDQHAEHMSAVGGSDPATDLRGLIIPQTQAAAVSELAGAERDAATSRRTSSVAATSPDLIWNLALIATSESQHAATLAKGGS